MAENLHIKFDQETELKELIIREGAALPPYDYKGYRYNLTSIQSIIDHVEKYGTDQNTVIFVSESRVQVIMDETVHNRPQDRLDYSFTESLDYREWRSVLGKHLTQKDFLDFLKRRTEGEVGEIEMLKAAVQVFKVNCTIVGEYDQGDNNNIRVAFKIGETESSVRLPKVFGVSMPLIHGSDTLIDMEVELEFTVPKNEGEKPTFKMSIPKFERYWHDAVLIELDKLKSELPGFLILDGETAR